MKTRIALATALMAVMATVMPSAQALDGPVVQESVSFCSGIRTNPNSVTLIGDSLVVLSLDAIRVEFANAGVPLCYNAQSGRRSDQAVPVLKTMREGNLLSAKVVLALGTNDTVLGNPTLNVAYQDELRYTYPRLTEFAIGWRGTDPYNAARVQMVQEEWDASIARVTSNRWGDIVKAHPEYLDTDGIHPNALGKVAYAKFLVASVP